MFTFISVPTDFIPNVANLAATILGDMSPVAVLFMGVLLGLMVLSWLIDKIEDVRTHREIEYHFSRLTPAERAEALSRLNIAERELEEEAFIRESLAEYKQHYF